MRLIITNRKGERFVVLYDKQDHGLAMSRKWHIEAGYATWKGSKVDGIQPTFLLHRMILGLTDPKIYTDHVNRNRLDNRRKNLRRCNCSQNTSNSIVPKRRVGASKYRGVTFPEHPRFGGRSVRLIRAEIRVKGRKTHIGYYDSEMEAARAYDAMATRVYGQFASLNFSRP